jgi:Tol biopolymer transport system component
MDDDVLDAVQELDGDPAGDLARPRGELLERQETSRHGARKIARVRPSLLGLACLLPLALGSCGDGPPGALGRYPLPQERHLKNLRQLTFGGQNAEAYWSFSGDRLVFQSTRPPFRADQIFVMGGDGSDPTLVSTGQGRTTCAYFLPGDREILYASTHGAGPAPPPEPDRSRGYVWPVFDAYDVYVVGLDGKNPRNLTRSPRYDAEATVSPKGDRILFTSARDDDLEIYSMKLDGSDVARLTNAPGYDGGAFYSPDGTKICWRAGRPETEEARKEFQALLGKGIVRPTRLEIWVADADGKNARQVTNNGKANFAPIFTPDGKRIVFSSNMDDPRGRSFDLYLVNLDGTGLERVTWYTDGEHDDFDSFPHFSPDGRRLAFCSNRHNAKRGETNVFVADWVD